VLSIVSLSLTGLGIASSVVAAIGLGIVKFRQKYKVKLEKKITEEQIKTELLEQLAKAVEDLKQRNEEITQESIKPYLYPSVRETV
jgi:hypothetical protein